VENKGSRMTEVIKEASMNQASKRNARNSSARIQKPRKYFKNYCKSFFMQDHENMILKDSQDFLTYSGFLACQTLFEV